MANIAPTTNRQVTFDESVVSVTWSPLTYSGLDVGLPVTLAQFSDKTFHAFGTWGTGGNVIVEGSNDGANWTALSNRQGNAMNLTSAAPMNTSQDRPLYVRARVNGGDGTTSVAVVAACHRADIPNRAS